MKMNTRTVLLGSVSVFFLVASGLFLVYARPATSHTKAAPVRQEPPAAFHPTYYNPPVPQPQAPEPSAPQASATNVPPGEVMAYLSFLQGIENQKRQYLAQIHYSSEQGAGAQAVFSELMKDIQGLQMGFDNSFPPSSCQALALAYKQYLNVLQGWVQQQITTMEQQEEARDSLSDTIQSTQPTYNSPYTQPLAPPGSPADIAHNEQIAAQMAQIRAEADRQAQLLLDSAKPANAALTQVFTAFNIRPFFDVE